MRSFLILGTALMLAAPAALPAQQGSQPIDSAYTAQIIELTPTHERWKFVTDLVDYLPAAESVPTPLEVIGYVPGTVGKLSRVADVNRYFRALDAASPRVNVSVIGTSDEGREMILAAISDEATLGQVAMYRAMADSLADPLRCDKAPGRHRAFEDRRASFRGPLEGQAGSRSGQERGWRPRPGNARI